MHTNKLDKVQNFGLRAILGAMNTTPIAEMEKTAELNHLRAEDKSNFSSMQKKWRGCQIIPCTTSSKTPQKQIEKEKFEPPDKRTAERTWRNPYNWCTPVWKIEPKQLTTRNRTRWDQDNHPWHHFEGTPKWSSFDGSGSGRDWQALSIDILDTHLHRWFSWKRHKKRRMKCLHQASRQTSILCVSTRWDTVLKLQSWSPSTAECHGNHHFVGRRAQESSLPHRLTVSSASPHAWWTWHYAKEAHSEHQHPRSGYLCCSSVVTSICRH